MRLMFLLFVLMSLLNSFGQETDNPDYSRLPDKAYLHLDKNLYAQGDTIWAKAYVFHRNNNVLSDNSYSLHIQVLSETGLQVGTYKMLIVGGIGYGQIPIYESMKPGFYQIIAHTGHMKNFGQPFFFSQTIEVSNNEGEVALKCFFDQAAYAIGDTAKVMISAYDEFQILIPKKKFRYRLTHKGEVVKKGASRCAEDGSVSIWFPVDQGTKDDPYKLDLVWFEEDENFALVEKNKTVYFPMVTEEVFVQFFPEGGDLVNGLNGTVAFEATNSLGKPVDIEGVLLEDDVEVLTVSSMHQGMGYFPLLPKDKTYTFRVTSPVVSNASFELPKVKKEGYGFAYLKQNEKGLVISLSHSYDEPQKLSLWVSQNDQLLNAYDLDVKKQRVFSFPKDLLPSGLVTFTLTDSANVPQAERLIYINKAQPELTILLNEKTYGIRNKVVMKVKTNPSVANAHLSVAVVDSVLGNSPWLAPNSIKSYALLATELKGRLSHLDHYLEDTKTAEVQRNLLLMTHGWRRYGWISNQKQLDSLDLFDFNNIDGKVMKRSKPQSNAAITAMGMGEVMTFAELKADDEGRFRLAPKYTDYKDTKIIFMAKDTKGKDNVKISLSNADTVIFSNVIAENKDNLFPMLLNKDLYFSNNDSVAEDQLPFLSYETKMLKELVVYGSRVDEEEEEQISESVKSFSAGSVSGENLAGGYSFASYVSQASSRAQYNSASGSIVVKGRAGQATGSDDNMGLTDDIGAVIYVNDMPWGKDPSSLDFLTKEEIAEIVVLDPEGAYGIYGSEGEYGVILVRTRSQDIAGKQHTMNTNMAVFGKFINTREFYQPLYETEEQNKQVVVDNRTTLHWSPLVTTDANGEAMVEFYTDDIGGAKQIVIQGMDDNGGLYYKTESFEVKVIGR